MICNIKCTNLIKLYGVKSNLPTFKVVHCNLVFFFFFFKVKLVPLEDIAARRGEKINKKNNNKFKKRRQIQDLLFFEIIETKKK